MNKVTPCPVPSWVTEFSKILQANLPNEGDVHGAVLAHSELSKNPAALAISIAITSLQKGCKSPTRYLTPAKAEELYGYSQSTFAKWRSEGGGPPFVRVGGRGRVLYPEEQLQNWIMSHGLVNSTAEANTTRPDLKGKPPAKKGEKRSTESLFD